MSNPPYRVTTVRVGDGKHTCILKTRLGEFRLVGLPSHDAAKKIVFMHRGDRTVWWRHPFRDGEFFETDIASGDTVAGGDG